MKRFFVLLALAILETGLLGSCKKDDIEDPEPQEGKTFEEIVKELPGVYLSAGNYDNTGNGRVIWLKEDGTTEQYHFFDNNVDDGINVDEFYSSKGTWNAFRVDDIPSETGICSKLQYEGSSEVEVDSSFVYFINDGVYVFSKIYGYDEFYKVSQTFEEFKKGLESFLPGHLKEKLVPNDGISEYRESSFIPPADYHCWMRDLPDDVYIRDLSIPGAHDAFSYRCCVDAQDQTLNAMEQFNWGVRWFDVRYYWSTFGGGKVLPCHGSYGAVNKLHSIESDLALLELCVLSNPSEGIIIRFQIESDMEQSIVDDANRELWLTTYLKSKSSIYVPVTKDMQLSDIRGKIAVMSGPGGDFCDTPFYFYVSSDQDQDEDYFNDKNSRGYVRQNYSYIAEKTNAFKKLIDEQRKELHYFNEGANDWTLNHCSGYLDTFRPVEFASNVTPKLQEVLSGVKENKTYGIVPMDFIGRGKVYESAACFIKEGIIAEQFPIHTPEITVQVVESSKRIISLPEYKSMQP